MAFDEGVGARALAAHVLADNEVGPNVRFGQLPRRLDARELHQYRNTASFRDSSLAKFVAGFVPRTRMPFRRKLQQISVVVPRLDHPTRRPEGQPIGVGSD
jgi:hypothetical protein